MNRRELRPVASADIKESVGIERGGLGPFSIVADSTVVIDDRVHDYTTIKCGGGSDTLTIEIDVPDLIRVTGAIVAPISKR